MRFKNIALDMLNGKTGFVIIIPCETQKDAAIIRTVQKLLNQKYTVRSEPIEPMKDFGHIIEGYVPDLTEEIKEDINDLCGDLRMICDYPNVIAQFTDEDMRR